MEAQAQTAKQERAFRRLMDRISKILTYIGIAFLMVMMLASVIDVLGRFFFNMPLPGSYEIVQYSMVAAVFFCFGHIQMVGGNISVEVVVDRLSRKLQDVIQFITTVVAIVLFAYFTYSSFLQFHMNSKHRLP
jgi:TRAP-type C4-dicarboxylate transport system permease small subunit